MLKSQRRARQVADVYVLVLMLGVASLRLNVSRGQETAPPALAFPVAKVRLLEPVAKSSSFPEPYDSEKSKTRPMPPEEVVKTARLPKGFLLSVFAAEPDVQNPIAMTTDGRGRVWVAENYTWSGANFGNYDTKLRDRIVILEDRNGDGRHDRRTVFWDQASKLTSVEVGFGGVWALALPRLLFIPDRNRDDVPDGPAEVVLDGIDEQQVGHTPANGLKWGPDGWLYARHGIQATSRIGVPGASDSQRIAINTGVWRYHPTRRVVETVMHGMTNSWGFDYDARGEMYVINTVIGHLWHLVPGAHVERMYGIDLNSHVYQLIQQTADHVHWDTGEKWNDVQQGVSDKTSAAGGGHAHIGLMIYQGDNWPDAYRGRVYTMNLHGQRLNSDLLAPQGAGFTATHGPDWCFISDPWYRGMDLITGADGGVYLADWSDTGECHDHDGVHRTSGRIYKLVYREPTRHADLDLTRLDDLALGETLFAANAWWGRQALRLLQERAAAGASLDTLHRWLNAPDNAKASTTPEGRIMRLRALAVTGGLSESQLIAALADADPSVRSWGVRLLVDPCSPGGEQLSAIGYQALVKQAHDDPAGLVQLYLASALQRLPIDARWEIAAALVSHSHFADDRMLPLLTWYGIEPAVPRDPKRALQLVKSSQIGLVRRLITRRLAVEIESQPTIVAALIGWVGTQPDTAATRDVVEGMAAAFRGWRRAPEPRGWKDLAQRLESGDDASLKQRVQELNVVFGDGRALDTLRHMILDVGAEPAARQQALKALLGNPPADFAPILQHLLDDRVVLTEALRGLAAYDHPDTPAQILNHLGLYSPEARVEMVNTLASRASYARALLEAVRAGQIARSELTAFHARQIRAFDDPQLSALLEEVWGAVRLSDADKQALIEQWRERLAGAVDSTEANPQVGRALFQKHCANCHVLYGTGRTLGPDLTGSNRKNLDYLLENVLDPSASVASTFRAVNVVLKDGRIANGVISAESERTLTLETAQESQTIDREDIDEVAATPHSMMPDGLLQNLSADEVRDLFRYLMTSDQVPLPRGFR